MTARPADREQYSGALTIHRPDIDERFADIGRYRADWAYGNVGYIQVKAGRANLENSCTAA